ncbi:MAG: hypothetical protein ABI557_01150, partial [Aureliella sp.]
MNSSILNGRELSSTAFPIDSQPRTALADVTRRSLNDFRRRRLLLWLCRRLGWMLLALVVVLLLAILADALW